MDRKGVLRGDMLLAHWTDTDGAPARRAPAGGTGVEHVSGRQYPVHELARAAARAPPRPRDPGYLPFLPARLLRDAILL